MLENIVIFGAGGLGREVLLLVKALAQTRGGVLCKGFVVDAEIEAPSNICGLPVWKDLSRFEDDDQISFVAAVGDPLLRRRVAADIERIVGPRFATLVHPQATVGATSPLGAGTIVMGNASITADASVGRHVLINPLASIAHDCVVEDFATLAPAVALAGGVRLREGCDLGIGACVIPRKEVGAWAKVGAGAVVIRDVPPNSTVAGVPARLLRNRKPTMGRE